MPEANPKIARSGGPAFHKNPECKCYPCAARRRKAEALALTGGAGGGDLDSTPEGQTLDVIDGDLPVQLASKRGKRSQRAHIARWVEIKTANSDLSNGDIAKQLGITEHTLNNIIWRATKEGWLTFEDPYDKLEYEIVPKVVRNLSQLLNEGDKQTTLETAKGTIFKTYQESKGLNAAPQTILAIKFEYPDAPREVTFSGNIVGKPKRGQAAIAEAEVLEIKE